MSTSEVFGKLNEIGELLKNAVPSSKAGDTAPLLFGISVPMGSTKFSLPSRCSWAALTCPSAFTFSFNSAASFSMLAVAAATPLYLAGNGPLDLSTLHVTVLAAASGATLSAWIQKAPDLA